MWNRWPHRPMALLSDLMPSMRILVLSFYFPPDLCAGSFRAGPFVDALSEAAGAMGTIDVITTLPNRYQSYSQEAAEVEARGNVSIRRLRVPSHHSGFIDQALVFGRFARSAWKATQGQDYDLVFATSSRLLTASLGAALARRKGARLFLDIRDVFSETIRDVLPRRLGRVFFPVISMVERFTVRSADRVNLVSEGFREYFQARYPSASYSFITNGIDDEFLGVDFRKTEPTAHAIVLYAGNIGESQGLDKILPEGARRMAGFEFWVVGDGGRRRRLQEEIERLGVRNVRIFPPVSRQELIELYRKADCLFLHLNDHAAFTRVLPSKLFEYAATGKAILAGVDGYARDFVEEHVSNARVFTPCNVNEFCEQLAQLSPVAHDRPEFVKQFGRRTLMAQLAHQVLAMVPKETGSRPC